MPRTPLPIINTYLPQGRNPQHEQFVYKLEWLARLRRFFEAGRGETANRIPAAPDRIDGNGTGYGKRPRLVGCTATAGGVYGHGWEGVRGGTFGAAALARTTQSVK